MEGRQEHKVKAVFTVIEDEKLQKPLFRRVGTGFVNRDASLTILLDALPTNGKLLVQDPLPPKKSAGAAEP